MYNDFLENNDVVISNIPGMRKAISHCGSKIHSITAFAPPLANTPMNIYIMTYNDQT